MSFPPYSGYNFCKTLHTDIYTATDPTKSDLSQPFKVVLVTGSGRGIGRSVALRYAEAGVASIILCARTASQLDSVEKEINAINPAVRVRKFAIDVADEQSVAAAAKSVAEEEGRLDVLVNNAGVTEPWVPIAQSKPVDYLATFNINVNGTYLMLQAFLPLLIETAKKESTVVDVINMTSIGQNVVMPTASGYQVSKAALSRLTEFIDAEYRSQGVNCIGLGPGAAVTDMTKDMEALKNHLPDTVDLAGGMAVWLTKGQRTWLGGRYVSATWDVTELESKKDEIVKGDKLKQRLVI